MFNRLSLSSLIEVISHVLAINASPLLSGMDILSIEGDNPRILVTHIIDSLITELTYDCTDEILEAYIWLLSILLDPVRTQIDGGYSWAIHLVTDVQTRFVSSCPRGSLSAWRMIMLAFHHARIPLIPLVQETFLRVDTQEVVKLQSTLKAQKKIKGVIIPVIEILREGQYSDPFILLRHINETVGDFYPPIVKMLLLDLMAKAPQPSIRDAAVLMTLDQEPTVRSAAIKQIEHMIQTGTLTQDSARRLLLISYWLPKNEQSKVESLVSTIPQHMILTYPKPLVSLKFYTTILDGSGTMSLYLTGGHGTQALFGAVLFNEQRGFVDTLSEFPTHRYQADGMIRMACKDIAAFTVGRTYFDSIVSHALSISKAPVIGAVTLLKLAELTGYQRWKPLHVNITTLISDLPRDLLKPEVIRSVLQRSGSWPRIYNFADSWFEAGAVFDQILNSYNTLREMEAAVLAYVIAPRRIVWAERFALSALAVRSSTTTIRNTLPLWTDFAILAKLLQEDCYSIYNIPLMQKIASRSVVAATVNNNARSN